MTAVAPASAAASKPSAVVKLHDETAKAALEVKATELENFRSRLLDTDIAEASAGLVRTQTLLEAARSIFARLECRIEFDEASENPHLLHPEINVGKLFENAGTVDGILDRRRVGDLDVEPDLLSGFGIGNTDLHGVFLLINSSTFRWFLDVVSDGSHRNKREIENFPFNLVDFNCSFNPITLISNMNAKLERLECNKNKLTSLEIGRAHV